MSANKQRVCQALPFFLLCFSSGWRSSQQCCACRGCGARESEGESRTLSTSIGCWSSEESLCVLNDFAWTERGINQELLCWGRSISSSMIKYLNVFNELELALKRNGLRKQKCQIYCGMKLQIKRISNFT